MTKISSCSGEATAAVYRCECVEFCHCFFFSNYAAVNCHGIKKIMTAFQGVCYAGRFSVYGLGCFLFIMSSVSSCHCFLWRSWCRDLQLQYVYCMECHYMHWCKYVTPVVFFYSLIESGACYNTSTLATSFLEWQMFTNLMVLNCRCMYMWPSLRK